ncbi:MAG TPA: hypothetical protein PLR53_09495 [Bacteroidales bacterium]|jgi:hypothetical protein|nr:hypothetical protein [Bacteroidales bacterium]
MKVNSPVGNLLETLQHLRNTAQKYQSFLSRSEASTRIALIDPLIRFLGWDSSNPNMIEFEKTIPPQSRVDYALKDPQNKINIIIEAKPLGGNLSDKSIVLNLVMYAFASGVKDIFLTDGVIWEHYTDYIPGNVGSTRTLNLYEDNLLDSACYLIQKLDAANYWPNEVEDTLSSSSIEQEVIGLRNEITEIRALLTTLQQPMEKTASTVPVNPHQPVNENQFIELSKLSLDIKGMKSPSLLRLPDGTLKPIHTWREILTLCCYFVLDHNPNIHIPLLDNAGKTKYLLDTKQPDKRLAQYPYEYNGRKIFIYANYDSKNCVLNALYLLKHLDEKKFDFPVAIQFSSDQQ